MYDFIFNEKQESEKKRLSVRGFTEAYQRMIYAVFSDGFVACDNKPQLVIAEADELVSEKNCPVIILGSPASKKKGREYLNRPVDLGELQRLGLALVAENEIEADPQKVCINSEKLSVSYGGEAVCLTKLEFQLFLMLKDAAGPLSREDIRGALWENTEKTNISDVYVCYLRKKLSRLFGDGFIVSLRGKGYVMRLP